MRAKKIGLLGGSFNPAHEGHLYISETALKFLGLDQVWWLVSPQNPLKSADEMQIFENRLSQAKAIISNPAIEVSDFELKHRRTYTADTLIKLKEIYPDNQFVWLMGADNLAQIPKWHKWQKIFETIPIAVFDRPGFTFKALGGKAARTYAEHRILPASPGRPILDFASRKVPAWTFVTHTKHKLSSTYIRKCVNNAGSA
ncbi:MAG: nicotinate-nucleotide adenylyltransferase [Sneathiella sp.]|nr:nicotinate-nucleotide adenylyltransferase [Sneathiella sp.]